nr:uncharacterized protein LOC124817279 [Hydra vulgaris]
MADRQEYREFWQFMKLLNQHVIVHTIQELQQLACNQPARRDQRDYGAIEKMRCFDKKLQDGVWTTERFLLTVSYLFQNFKVVALDEKSMNEVGESLPLPTSTSTESPKCIYPKTVISKGDKSNFRRKTKPFVIEDNELYHLGKSGVKRKVIWCKEEQHHIIKSVHDGNDISNEANALSGHIGINSTTEHIKKIFFWFGMVKDITAYVSECETLSNISIPKGNMKHVGIDLTQLPEVNGYKYLIVLVDYFSKWVEAEPLFDKTAKSVAIFLYKQICRHGCFEIQINDQGREFVNELSNELHRKTGTRQRMTSAYHPQANGLVERQNQSIKRTLVKVLEDAALEWPFIIDGVLFSMRIRKHKSTGFSPFELLYQREPFLPIDIDQNLIDYNDNATLIEDDSQNKKAILETFNKMNEMKKCIFDEAYENIQKSQVRQKHNYDKRVNPKNSIAIGTKVLLRNHKRDDRKGGMLLKPWIGPYTYNLTSLSLYKEKTLCNGSIQIEEVNKLSNDNDIKIEPVIKDVESSKSYINTQHESCVNVLDKEIAKCATFEMRKLIAEKAVSFIITGSEDEHKQIRDKVVNHMCNQIHDEMTGYLSMPIQTHICKTRMLEDATWATDAEKIGCASFMEVDIQVYSKYGEKTKWMIYPCSLRLNKLSDYSIFLDNSTGFHFDVVNNS